MSAWRTFLTARRLAHRGKPLAARGSGEGEAVGDGGGLGAAADAELGEDAGDVDAGGLLRHVELGGDLAVGRAFGHQREDLALARGEAEGVVLGRSVGGGGAGAVAARPVARSGAGRPGG